jgi:hypothetical protein
LKLIDVGLFTKDGRSWAALPTKPVLDSQHRHHTVNGKRQYQPAVEWRDRDLNSRWSDAVVALVRDRHPGALDERRSEIPYPSERTAQLRRAAERLRSGAPVLGVAS